LYSEIKNILYNIIAERTPYEYKSILGDFVSQTHPLMRISLVNTLLHDTATVLVTCNLDTLINHSIIKKLVSFWFPALENFLNYMITVDVFTHFLYILFKETLNEVKMNVFVADFYYFLDRSRSMRIFTELYRLFFHRLNYFCELS